MKISESIRQTVIRLWLENNSRKDIAVTCGVSEGTVSNIVSDWRQKLGDVDVEALRELGSNLKRCRIDAVRCAQGFRISMIMRKMGINEEYFESFISKAYERCQKVEGLTPDKMGSYLEDLLEFSKDEDDDNGDGNTIKLSEIPHYIEQKKNEKRTLKQDIEKLHKEKQEAQQEASYANELRDAALENEKTTVAKLREYSNLKAGLKKYDLDIHTDIPKFVKLVNSIKHYSYNVHQVLSEFEDLQSLKFQCEYLGKRVNQLVNQKKSLEQSCSILQDMASFHSQKLSACDELKSMGLGLNKLRLMINSIKEIAAENNIIDYRLAIDKFFEFLEQRYDIKLRQKVLDEQQQELQKYNNNNTAKPDNPNRTFPLSRNNESSSVAPKPSALVNRQREMPSSSISYTYSKSTTIHSKTTAEEEDEQIKPYQDEWDRSDDDRNT